MGYKVSWLARSGDSGKELISASRRKPTGELVPTPSNGYQLIELTDTSWVVLLTDGAEYLEDLDAEMAQSLSEGGCEILRFWCSDTIMATQLECYREGVRVWSIGYDCEETEALVIEGEVPPITHDLLKTLVAKQRADPEVDFVYELTAKLGSELTGFRHDQSLGKGSPPAFRALDFESDRTPVPKQPWWKRWL